MQGSYLFCRQLCESKTCAKHIKSQFGKEKADRNSFHCQTDIGILLKVRALACLARGILLSVRNLACLARDILISVRALACLARGILISVRYLACLARGILISVRNLGCIDTEFLFPPGAEYFILE